MKNYIKAFTLAEILIVLVIIGVLTMILLPVAFQSSPDEDVMKFKKANNTLGTVIRELVSSDKYYQNGDLGTTYEGKTVSDNGKTTSYFCKTFADVVGAKEVNCQSSPVSGNYNYIVLNEENLGSGYKPKNPTEENIANSKIKLDTMCLDSQSKMPEEIVFSDGVVFYSAGTTAFGTQYIQSWNEKGEIATNEHIGRFFSPPDMFPANYGDENGFDMVYRVVCLDVDGFDKEENPFGYGIRADGKILTGKRADEWINKSIQN